MQLAAVRLISRNPELGDLFAHPAASDQALE
jgi:hypothetical protein